MPKSKPIPPVHAQLEARRVAQGLSLQALHGRSRLPCSLSSLSRKLAGVQPMITREAERLARALRSQVVIA